MVSTYRPNPLAFVAVKRTPEFIEMKAGPSRIPGSGWVDRSSGAAYMKAIFQRTETFHKNEETLRAGFLSLRVS